LTLYESFDNKHRKCKTPSATINNNDNDHVNNAENKPEHEPKLVLK